MKNIRFAVQSFKEGFNTSGYKKLSVFAFVFALLHIIIFAIFGSHLMASGAGIATASFLGSIPASSSGSFTVSYVPQFIGFTAATVPTNFQIEVNGQPMVFSLDGNGLTGMTNIRQENRVANTYIFQLADGLIGSKNTVFNITNAVASTLSIYGWSPVKQGANYFEYSRGTVLAGATVEIADFAYLAFPSAAVTDRFQIAYNDGSVDNCVREEVNYALGYAQGDLTSKYNIDNINPARISRVFFTGTAQQTFYKLAYRPA